LRDYGKAIALDPNSAAAFANRGNVHRLMQRWAEALADYNRALSLNDKLGETYYGRALTRQHLGDSDGALADLTKAAEFDPDRAEIYGLRGNLFYALGDDTKALADFGRAIDLAPRQASDAEKYIGGYIGRGRISFERGDYKAALDDLDEALRAAKPGTGAGIQAERGLVHFAMGNFRAASADFAKLRDAKPPHPYAPLWSYFAQARQTPVDMAVLKELAAGAAWPGPIASFLLGSSTRGDLDRAASQGDEKARNGYSCEIAFYLGEQALVEKRNEDAKVLIRQAAEICPNGFLERGAALAEWRRLQ
jgi:tetratricopeptide (TPR) repeat protein